MQDRHITLLEFATCHLGTAFPELAARVEQHLLGKCSVCQGADEFVGYLTGVMVRDKKAMPPEAVVARARALFHSLPESPPVGSTPYESLARLVFDSFQEPAPAGVRGRFSTNRHMVFDDRGLVVDLRLEPEAGTKRQAITGQLQSQGLDARQLEGLPLMLVSQGRVIECGRTTAMGEFLFRNVPCEDLSLYVMCADRMVRVPRIPPAIELG